MKIIVTGGAGFIGSHLVNYLLQQTDHKVINLDKLTYAGNLDALAQIEQHANYQFVQGDIVDTQLLSSLLASVQPDAIMHLAAETHVDNSINSSSDFINTNILGTYTLLEQTRKYWLTLTPAQQQAFRFLHISTDEVYGSLGATGTFSEDSKYSPNSPYSASKAASDHLVRAWHATYKLPILVTNCSNNYGTFQHPEKLIPKTIMRALEGKSINIYGSGQQVRDWLYVQDHVQALHTVLTQGKIDQTYNIGGKCEKTNLEVVQIICSILDKLYPAKLANISSYSQLIAHVADRAGHDFRYAIDPGKIMRELNWQAQHDFIAGITNTIQWYIDQYTAKNTP
jgi:dTDP-glucose 4,6-dehydratase